MDEGIRRGRRFGCEEEVYGFKDGRRREREGRRSDGEKLMDETRSLFRLDVLKVLILSVGAVTCSLVSVLLFVLIVEMAKGEELSFEEVSTRRRRRPRRRKDWSRAVEKRSVGLQGDREGRGIW